jgi:hypothetical protein
MVPQLFGMYYYAKRSRIIQAVAEGIVKNVEVKENQTSVQSNSS